MLAENQLNRHIDISQATAGIIGKRRLDGLQMSVCITTRLWWSYSHPPQLQLGPTNDWIKSGARSAGVFIFSKWFLPHFDKFLLFFMAQRRFVTEKVIV